MSDPSGAKKPAEPSLLCPSAPAGEGAIVLGVVRSDGTVGYLGERLPVTAEFLDRLRSGPAPEARFRFGAPCRESACAQWSDGGCGLPGGLAALVPPEETPDALPRCSIRRQCRWFHQRGVSACRICPLVMTREAGVPAVGAGPHGRSEQQR
ncbi:hypothetical protein ACFQ8C_23500 [Streptomyces sp. NPDC056503]|uniref:hypothetical protein n=1 Tax=Streptomyces sp. NPDC056503 TaxID=3345842 RepID=UPI0036CA2362